MVVDEEWYEVYLVPNAKSREKPDAMIVLNGTGLVGDCGFTFQGVFNSEKRKIIPEWNYFLILEGVSL
ncbi:MAG TPA: hypothetical protein VLL74_02240 [Methanoregula sp.]|nr:hypothetical protein [Methanoregula sp.]